MILAADGDHVHPTAAAETGEISLATHAPVNATLEAGAATRSLERQRTSAVALLSDSDDQLLQVARQGLEGRDGVVASRVGVGHGKLARQSLVLGRKSTIVAQGEEKHGPGSVDASIAHVVGVVKLVTLPLTTRGDHGKGRGERSVSRGVGG